MTLEVLTPREASIFACLCDTVVAPEPLLPPVKETDAVRSFDRLLAASPPLNRVALRALLYAVELAPHLAGGRRRLRRLTDEERGTLLARLEEREGELLKLVKALACLSYYGDEAVMRRLGYDPEARVRRGKALRADEGRP